MVKVLGGVMSTEKEEWAAMVWDALLKLAMPSTAQQISLESGLHHMDVRKALSTLVDCRLVSKEGASPHSMFAPVFRLSAMEWAQALHVGISLSQLEQHAVISEKERAEAFRMASDGEVDAQQISARASKQESIKQEKRGRAAARAAATDLARLVADTEKALSECKPGGVVHLTLSQAHQEAEKALDRLTRSLLADERTGVVGAVKCADRKAV